MHCDTCAVQPPSDPAGKRHFEDLHSSFSGENLNLYDTLTSTEGDLNTHPNSRARVPHCSNEVTSWATVQEEGGQAGALPAANQLVRSYLHPRISDQTNAKRCDPRRIPWSKCTGVFVCMRPRVP
jgi:hypothetical protein